MAEEETSQAAEAPAAEGGAPLDALKAQNAAYLDQLLRLKAEFENYRKRVDRERPELVRHGREDMLGRLLPFYDVLLTAHKQVQAAARPAGAESLAEGVEMLFKEISKFFAAEGVEAIDCMGKPYDHVRHEVLGTVERDDLDDETVVEELQRGFTSGGRVLRPARVRISRRPAGAVQTPDAPAQG